MWSAFVNLFDTGGWVLYPIFAVSVLSWYLGLGRLEYYRRFARARTRFLAGRTGSRHGAMGLDAYEQLSHEVARSRNYVERSRAARGFMTEVLPQLGKGLSTMTACVVIAPLLGLLGTITGMNQMFSVIGEYGFGNPTIMASGISMALQATLTGLGVAVAVLLFQNYLVNRKTRMIDAINKDMKALLGPEETPETEAKGAKMRGDYRLVPQENEKPEINLAPFVDTIMILLIFFVVTANLYVETGVDVSKPKAQSARSVGQKSILIGVTREGTVHIYGRQISLERLNTLVHQEVNKQPDLSIVIIADREAVVGKAVQVMDQCLMAGAQKISLAAGKD